MNTANEKNNGIRTGLHVVFTAEYLELTGRGTVSEIFEVTDSRHVGQGHYVFSLTPVTVPASMNAAYTSVDPYDLEPVG